MLRIVFAALFALFAATAQAQIGPPPGGGSGVTSIQCNGVTITTTGTCGALTGDVTSSAGAAATTLKNTGPGATGPLGSTTTVPVVTIDAQGRVTGLTSATIAATVSSVQCNGVTITTTGACGALTGDITSSAGAAATTLKNTGPGATGPIGSATTTPSVTIDAQGRVTGLTSNALQKATNAVFGVMEGDGTTITCVAGVCTATTGGGGTVTSVGAGCGTSTGGSPITGAGNVIAAITRRANTTTSDTIVAADCGNLLSESNASSIAVAIAQAGTTGFAAGAYFSVCNIGAGTATITPTTSTIGGASTLPIPGGSAAAPVCYAFQSDGTNYNILDGPTVNAALLSGGTLAAGRMPALTGDVTTSAGAVATTLATVNTNVGSFGSATSCPAFTVNGKGLITAASQATCTPAIGSVTGLGTGVGTALGSALSANGGLTTTIASGATALGTGSISSATCATVVTATATNTATTDVVTASFNGDPSAVTGYIPSTSGMLTILVYPTANNVNFKVCNNTASPVTPGAITLNWRVTR